MKRLFGLDLIRTFAILFVLGVHFFLNTDFYNVPCAGISMLFQAFLRWIFIICVPLFLLLTGYLQAKKELERNYYKNIIPILGVYVLYSALSIIVRTYYFKEQEPFIVWISSIMGFSADGYSWYINMYIGLFLLIPFLNIMFGNLKKQKDRKILILTMIFLTGLPGFFNAIPSLSGVIHFPDWWSTLYPITYYYLGAYIREYRIKINKIIAGILFAFTTIFETLITAYFSNGINFFNAVGEYGSVVILIQSVLFFLIFYDIKSNRKYIIKIFSTISLLSLDIYLCSYISDRIVYDYVMSYIYRSQQQIIYYSLFIVIASFILSATVAFLRYKISDISSCLIRSFNQKENTHSY